MEKVAIVGVEGSGKTVMLAGLGELCSHADENGFFLAPKDFATMSYVTSTIAKMRQGIWPSATAEDVLQGLDWTIRRKENGNFGKPTDICEVACLDFAGEVYRAAFGIEKDMSDSDEVRSLKEYVRNADSILVLINLRDVIVKGMQDKRVQESIWITNGILSYALENSDERTMPRAAIVLSQSDSYRNTIDACGGPKGVLAKYLPHVANSYGWLDVIDVCALDKLQIDDEGRICPHPDFSPIGLRPIVDWILKRDVYLSGISPDQPTLIETICNFCGWPRMSEDYMFIKSKVENFSGNFELIAEGAQYAVAQDLVDEIVSVGADAVLMPSGRSPEMLIESEPPPYSEPVETPMTEASPPVQEAQDGKEAVVKLETVFNVVLVIIGIVIWCAKGFGSAVAYAFIVGGAMHEIYKSRNKGNK